ncbi:MAG: hypothetical protein JWL65_667 [Gammaproteobacteria bacterium]|nr:hypothetical protein [Gammaproteobacteria bacterium]
MTNLPTIVFDVNETLLDRETTSCPLGRNRISWVPISTTWRISSCDAFQQLSIRHEANFPGYQLGARRSRLRWAACLNRFPHRAMLHQRRPRMCERSRNSRVQTAPSQALMLEKSSLQTSSAMVSATGRSSVSGVCQRLTCRQATPERTELSRAGSRLTIWPNPWSRSRIRFKGARSFRASGFRGLPLYWCTKPRNHSLKARACAATASNSPGRAARRIEVITSGGTSFATASQSSRSVPELSHSTGVSTGDAIELRKSSARVSPTNIGGGRASMTKSDNLAKSGE